MIKYIKSPNLLTSDEKFIVERSKTALKIADRYNEVVHTAYSILSKDIAKERERLISDETEIAKFFSKDYFYKSGRMFSDGWLLDDVV